MGVVGDVRVRGLERASEPQVYVPDQQVPDGGVIFYAPKDLAVRTAVDPASLVPAIRRVVAQVDPQQPISDVRTMAEVVREETGARAVQVRVLGAFAAAALLLAAVGIHGLLSFVVRSRSQEIGVRIALGARSPRHPPAGPARDRPADRRRPRAGPAARRPVRAGALSPCWPASAPTTRRRSPWRPSWPR